MENQIFKIKAGSTQSLVLRSDEIWLCLDKIKSLEKFEKVVQQTGLLSIGYTIPYSSINEVFFKDLSETVTIKYLNKKGVEKKFKAEFNNISQDNEFGNYLGTKLEFHKEITQERKIKQLLINLLYLIFTIAATVYLTSIDTLSLVENSSGKNRGISFVIYIIVDTIGHTGVYIIGGLISLFIIYDLYKRYNNPSGEIVFKRPSKVSY